MYQKKTLQVVWSGSLRARRPNNEHDAEFWKKRHIGILEWPHRYIRTTWTSIPGGSVCCIGSKIAFLCGVKFFHMSHKLGRQFLVFCRFCCFCYCCCCCSGENLLHHCYLCQHYFWCLQFFLSLQLMALTSMVTWLFTVMACRFGFFRVEFCGLLRHIVHLKFVGSFQTV